MTKEEKQIPVKRWTAQRKLEIILRFMRGEALDDLSREIGVPASEIEGWHQTVLRGAEVSLKSRGGDPLQAELDQAKKQIGELSMQIEILKKRPKGVFQLGRWQS